MFDPDILCAPYVSQFIDGDRPWAVLRLKATPRPRGDVIGRYLSEETAEFVADVMNDILSRTE